MARGKVERTPGGKLASKATGNRYKKMLPKDGKVAYVHGLTEEIKRGSKFSDLLTKVDKSVEDKKTMKRNDDEDNHKKILFPQEQVDEILSNFATQYANENDEACGPETAHTAIDWHKMILTFFYPDDATQAKETYGFAIEFVMDQITSQPGSTQDDLYSWKADLVDRVGFSNDFFR